MSDFVGLLANCLIEGDSFTEVEGIKVRNKISFNLLNKTIDIIQNPNLFNNKKTQGEFQNKYVQTTKIIIHEVDESNIEEYSSLVLKLSTLLSFITNSQVVYYGYEYPAGQLKKIWASFGRTNIYHNVIELHRGDEIKNFITSTWKSFNYNYERRKLPLIFSYIFEAFSFNTTETKLVFSYVILESLKFTYAKEKGFTFYRGYFRDNSNKKLNFNILIEMMLKEFNIVFNVKEITELRNDIIHSGYTEKDPNHNFKIFIYCQNLIRTYLIKLLGYNGFYIQER